MSLNNSIIVLISSGQEWKATKEMLNPDDLKSSPLGEWFKSTNFKKEYIFFHGGWGKISSAATTQYVIDHWNPSMIVNIGTCGGFAGCVEKGDLLLVEETIVYDIVEQMVDPQIAFDHFTTKLDISWLPQPYPLPVKKVRLVSGDRDIVPADIPWLKSKFGAVAGDWESASIAWVASRNGIPCLILRGVSDVVHDHGSETYGNIEAFVQGVRLVFTPLLKTLDQWIG